MGSRGRMPPPPAHMRRPLPGPGISHHDAFGPGMQPPPGAFPPFDMPPHPEILEQKLSAQHMEMQKLVTENQRLAGTHGALRQELAAAQHELQMLHAQIGAVKSEREQQIRGLLDKIARMEADLKAAGAIKSDLEKARADAQSLVVARQELISKAQKLSQDLQRAHADTQIIPALMSELDGLRQEYQHCRATYDYEKKLYNDHLESLQVMEKNYVNMAKEVEKLQAELNNTASADRRSGGRYGGTVFNENEVAGQYAAGQKASEDGHGVSQGHNTLPVGGIPVASAGSTPAQAAAAQPSAPAPPRAGYDPQRGPTYDVQRGGPGYDPQRGPPYYDAQRGYSYTAPGGGAGYDLRGAGFDPQQQAAAGYYEAQWGTSGYEAQRGSGYDVAKAVNHPQGQVAAPPSNVGYAASTAPPNRDGPGYEVAAARGNPGQAPAARGGNPGQAAARGGNPGHR